MRFIFKILGFAFLQFTAFALLMSASQGGLRAIMFLILGSIVSILSFYVLFKSSKK